MEIRKVVIPAAGLGTRLLTVTKEMPKEMMPVFVRNSRGSFMLKPLLQVIFEQLYELGFREFCFIVGRGKRAVEDHFTADYDFTRQLREQGKDELAEELESFYKKLLDSFVVFINQPKPRGFGDAVYCARFFTKDEPFMVHAGDDLVLSKDFSSMKKLIQLFSRERAEAVFLVERVQHPQKYGVIVGEDVGEGVFEVRDILEKPKHPPTDLAVVAVYLFRPSIYRAIERVSPDASGEIQLTHAIKFLIEDGKRVLALLLGPNERRLDVGTPESYWKTLKATFEWSP